MRATMLVVLWVSLLAVGAGAQPAGLDQTDPAAVARAYLEACDRWDLEAASALIGSQEEVEALRQASQPGHADILEQALAEGLCSPLLKHLRHVPGEVVVTGNECRVRGVATYALPTTLVLRRDEAGNWRVALEESMLSTGGGARALLLQADVPAAAPGTGDKAKTTACLANLKQLALAAHMYAADNNGVFPAAETWCDDLCWYLQNTQVFCCPVNPYGYAFNAALSRRPIAQIRAPSETVLFFETARRERDAVGDPTKVPLAHRHEGGDCFGYVDGHVKWGK